MTDISLFQKAVYKAIKKIPQGKVSTYAQIAKYIGKEKSYRAVGNALNRNPFTPTVPCHRVVLSSGFLGGYAFGKNRKISLLKKEGVEVYNDKVLDFEKKLFKFKV